MKQLNPAQNPLDKGTVIVTGICALTTGALFYNLLPLILGLSAEALALSSTQIGWLGTIYLLAFAGVSPFGFYLIRRFNWKVIYIVCTLFAVVCFVCAVQRGALVC